MEGAQFLIYRSLAQPQTRIETMIGPKQIPGGTGREWSVREGRGGTEEHVNEGLLLG